MTSIDCLEYFGHFNNIDSSNPRTLYFFPSVYHLQFLSSVSLEYRSFASLDRFIPRYYILFGVMVNVIVFLISLSDI